MTKKKLNDIIWLKDVDGHRTVNTSNTEAIKELLNSTGPGFCLAKWTQITIHLGSGTLHSCHHPEAHKIPLNEVERDPMAIYNTSTLLAARKEMLDGGRPSECDYCWRIEDNGALSDRFYKSIEPWALDNHDRIQDSDPNTYVLPEYLEVDFSNVCNLACGYCGPEFSSKWVENIKQHGPIKLLKGTAHEQWAQGWQNLDSLQYKNNEQNPYIDAFWATWPKVYANLKVYRITGGEPLLSKETFRSIDWLIENPNPELDFSINSNLCVPQKLWEQFLTKIQVLVSTNSVKKFTMFVSVDGWGKQAEYGRPGLNFELFKQRYEEILAIGNIRAVVMCTFNILSITSIGQVLEWQADLRRKYNPDPTLAKLELHYDLDFSASDKSYHLRKQQSLSHHGLVGIDMPYLRHPKFLDAIIADRNLIQNYLIPAMNYMANNSDCRVWGLHQGFESWEVEKFKRVVMGIINYWHTAEQDPDTRLRRAKFYDFVQQQDARHGMDFKSTFPEMADFLETCRVARETFK